MRLTVVGSGGGVGVADEASSGYLVTSVGASLLLDCGPGIATRLPHYIALNDLVGVVISHMHLDHCYDLITLAVMLFNNEIDLLDWEDRGDALPPLRSPIPVHLPPGGIAYLTRVIAAVSEGHTPRTQDMLSTILVMHEYQPDTPFAVGPFRVTAIGPVAHGPGFCCGLRVTDMTATLGYSGDSAACDALEAVARGVDLLLCDAIGITARVRTGQQSRHMTADEAGDLASHAGARRLVLTHIVDGSQSWREAMIHAARARYLGPVDVAHKGAVYRLPVRSQSRSQ